MTKCKYMILKYFLYAALVAKENSCADQNFVKSDAFLGFFDGIFK